MSDDDKKKPEVEDTRTVAENESTGIEHEPTFEITIRPRLAPSGSVGVSSQNTKSPVRSIPEKTLGQKLAEIDLSRNDISVEDKNKGMNVLVRMEAQKSDIGIDGGYISRLTLTQGDRGAEKILAHYDNGQWLKPPDTFLEKQVVMEAKERDNGIEVADIRPDKNVDIDNDYDI